MSLRVRTPTGAALISNFEESHDPPSTSKARTKSFFGEKEWVPSTVFRRMSLLVLCALVVYSAFVTSSATSGALESPITSTSAHHDNLRKRQTTDSNTQCT